MKIGDIEFHDIGKLGSILVENEDWSVMEFCVLLCNERTGKVKITNIKDNGRCLDEYGPKDKKELLRVAFLLEGGE